MSQPSEYAPGEFSTALMLLPSAVRLAQSCAARIRCRCPTRETRIRTLPIVADPYLSADRYKKEVFGKNSLYDAGIVAIDVYFRNDNDPPIRLNLDTIQTGHCKSRSSIASGWSRFPPKMWPTARS